jgi:hypothetical protein
MKKARFLLLAAPLLLVSAAQAQETGEAKKRFGLLSQIEASSNLKTVEVADHSSSLAFYFYPAYDLSDSFRARAAIESSQDLTGERKFTLITSDLGLMHTGVRLNPYLKLLGVVWFSVPVATSISNTSLITTVRLAPRLAFDFTRKIPLSGFYEASFARLFHRYFTTAEGKSNNRYSIAQRVVLSVQLPAKFSIDTDLRLRSGWSYQGSLSNTFVWGESIGYEATPALGFSVGVSNEAGILKANGYESNIALINQATTQISGSVSYTY